MAPTDSASDLARIVRILAASGVHRFAFTGALAQGVWARPRQSHDVDIVGEIAASDAGRLMATRDGIRSGSSELPDLVRFRAGDRDVDLFVAKGAYYQACLARAVGAEIEGERVAVVTPEDLAIQKVLKLRTDRHRAMQDVADLRALLAAQAARFDWHYVRNWLRPGEHRLLESLRDLDDDTILARLGG